MSIPDRIVCCYRIADSFKDDSSPPRVQPSKSLQGEQQAAVAGRPNKMLQAMADNPRADWTIADVKTVAEKAGLTFTKPSSGSHFKVSSRYLEGILTIPAHRPIKAIYIRRFTSLAEAHADCEKGQQNV